jgi:hypothetical protein
MKAIGKLGTLIAAAAMFLACGLFATAPARAEVINQDPFTITISANSVSGIWTSPQYGSPTLAGYACVHVTLMEAHIAYWTATLYANNAVSKGVAIWASKHQDRARSICSPYTEDGPPPTVFYLKIRAYIAVLGTAGQLKGISDIYTDFECGSLCGGIKPR